VGLNNILSGMFFCFGEDFVFTEISMKSFLNFCTSKSYEPIQSLNTILVDVFESKDLKDYKYFAELLKFTPPILQHYYGKGEMELLRKKLEDGQYLQKLEKCVSFLKKSERVKKWLRNDENFERFCSIFLSPISKMIELKKSQKAKKKITKKQQRKDKSKAAAIDEEFKIKK
jgi:hypothetical protein